MPAGDVETRDDLADRRQRLTLTAGEHQHAHRVIGMQGKSYHWDPHRDRLSHRGEPLAANRYATYVNRSPMLSTLRAE
jgi:hypothetical protein